MAFYYESIDLDLKKNFTNLEYQSLEVDFGQAYSVTELEQPQQGQSLIEERDQLVKDVKNMCTYFYLTCCTTPTSEQSLKLKEFPFEKVKNRLCHIVEKYQEQSSLLDSLLEILVTPLANVMKLYVHQKVQEYLTQIKSNQKDEGLILADQFHTVCDSIYMIGKVRGIRHICRYFPHEVRDLEVVVMILQKTQKVVDVNAHWETNYVLLLWLSVIVLVPFDLQTIDSNLFIGLQEQISIPSLSGSILLCLLNLGISFLRSSTRIRNAGALFLSKLFSRPDVLKTPLLAEFVKWSVETIQKLQDDVVNGFFVTGILETLVEILKTGQRNELKPHLPQMIPLIQVLCKGNSLINLFITKLSQRIGLVYLRPRVVSWAYKKGNQNLATTLMNEVDHSKLVTNAQTQKQSSQTINQEDQMLKMESADYYADVDQNTLEVVIDNLLIALTNKDTIVRWSAAKGVGRICSRLDMEQADDVFSALLETCFTPTQGDTAWHGGCLALGEVCRRGLILEARLPQVIPIVCKALVFEQNQGGYSVGVNVRDSACYVAWSASRAYDPQVLLPYLPALSQTLVVVMLYDREVNVRRAASSTFQELVGRCPNVIPHGIEILTESDYFALALRHNAYLKVAPFVAGFREYYPQMVDHLAFVKVQSQDKDVRLLSSKALSRLVAIDTKYFVNNGVFIGLLDMVQQPSVNGRHGSLYALGDLIVAAMGKTDSKWEDKELKDSVFLRTLTKNERQLAKPGEHIGKWQDQFNQLLSVNNLHLVPKDILMRITAIPKYIESQKLLRGKVGEILRVAVCRLIECISLTQLEVSEEQHQFYLEIIEEFLKNPMEESQDAAVRALTLLSQSYHTQYEKAGLEFLDKVLKELVSPNKLVIKAGYAQAIGAFSPNILIQRLKEIVKVLSHVGISKKSTPHAVISLDPDTRKYAVKSLGQTISKLLASQLQVDPTLVRESILALLRSLQDYTMNKRGDVGLYIRENAIVGLQQILAQFAQQDKSTMIDADLLQSIIGSLLQQLLEKIDRVRLVAGSVLQDLFKTVIPKLTPFPHIQVIAQVFSTHNLQEALALDQGRVDQSFQSEVIEAEVKHVKQILAHMRQTELVYHWNLPHCCYRLIVPLMALDNMSYSLLKGLCVSVGGISESTQKFSGEALTDFMIKDVEARLPQILDSAFKLMQHHAMDERIINPLFNTLALILEREEVQSFTKLDEYMGKLFTLVMVEIKGLQSIKKVFEAVPLIVAMLQLTTMEKQGIELIIELLSCDLPIVRKLTADKFYLFLLSYEDESLIPMESNALFQDYLLETDWLANQFDRELTCTELNAFYQK